MPPAKLKPSEIAAEAKKTYIPWIRQNYSGQHPPTSVLCYSDQMIYGPPDPESTFQTRFGIRKITQLSCLKLTFTAFYNDDPVDIAIKWHEGPPETEMPIPVILPANDKRPGGDWEAGVMSAEECICRRSNLVNCLTNPVEDNAAPSNYPIPTRAGIYSKDCVIFRAGPAAYELWDNFKAVPIISVCPVKRPKLDSAGRKYSFDQEKELMRDKIKTALRIARFYGHVDLCIGNFGLGPGFRNPVEEVAKLWRHSLMRDEEFIGVFRDVVFAFCDPEGVAGSPSSGKSSSSHGSSKSSGSKSSSSKSSSSSSSSSKGSSAASDLAVFMDVFKPSKVNKS